MNLQTEAKKIISSYRVNLTCSNKGSELVDTVIQHLENEIAENNPSTSEQNKSVVIQNDIFKKGGDNSDVCLLGYTTSNSKQKYAVAKQFYKMAIAKTSRVFGCDLLFKDSETLISVL